MYCFAKSIVSPGLIVMQNEEIKSFEDIEILHDQFLGKGYISTVKLAKSRTSGKVYAIKVVR